MAERQVKLSIIILSWNTKELLKQCLKSLVQSAKFKVQSEIIVVDNGSTDGSPEMVKKEFPQAKLIQNKENLGFAKGNNLGLRQAQGEYIMLLNSDTIIQDKAIDKLVDFLDSHSEIDIVGPQLLNQDGSLQANCGRFPNLGVAAVMLFKEHLGGSDYVRCSPPISRPVDWLMGAAFMARANVFKTVGGLDEKMFMYMEEVEWFFRSRQRGFKAYFLKEAKIIHLGRGSSKSGKREPILNIYGGLLHYYRKHKSPPELFLLEIMLKTKALIALTIGWIRDDSYLKKTYGEAIKIN